MKSTTEQLAANGLDVVFYDDDMYRVPMENASRWYANPVGEISGMVNGKIPKRCKDLVGHICKEYARKSESVYASLQPLFAKMDLRHTSAYATTYGVGVCALLRSRAEVDAEVAKIADALSSRGITYRNEYSLEHWVFRFVIHTNRENLERVRRA